LSASPQTLVLRATQPKLRNDKNSPRTTVSWGTALDHAASRFADAIKTHGADAVAFYVSGQLLTEDEILTDLNAGLDLPALQEKRTCGTSCGSCVTELKRLAAGARKAA